MSAQSTGEGRRIRPTEACDLATLQAIEERCFDPPWSRAALEAELDHERGLALVIESDGVDDEGDEGNEIDGGNEGIDGYAFFRHLLDEAELLRLAVTPERQRLGLARQLLAASWPRLTRLGVERCWLEVRADNHAAIAFYTTRGFTEAGRRRAYYRDGCDALLMQRTVPVR